MRSLFVQLPNFDMLVRCYTPGEVQQVDHSAKSERATGSGNANCWEREGCDRGGLETRVA